MGLEEPTAKLSIEDQTPSPGREGSVGATPSADGSAAAEPAGSASKPKRVRTGCLTCRERHLKCDEGAPVCQNCKKSNRTCKRGVRLNFIDTKVEDSEMVPQSSDWNISFRDESRDIASEYKGGASRYAVVDEDVMDTGGSDGSHAHQQYQQHPHQLQQHSQHQQQHQHQHQHQLVQHSQPQHVPTHPVPLSMPPAPTMPHQPLPPIVSPPLPPSSHNGSSYTTTHSGGQRRGSAGSTGHQSVTSYSSYQSFHPYQQTTSPPPSQQQLASKLTPPNEARDSLTDPEEVLFMQVFVEEVGVWMDSMDPYKHFSRILPFYALAEPMLLNSFLACGARHLSLVNPAFHEDKALHYYDTATRALLKSLQNPSRDTVICATAAVILNVYEVMTERALQRMNHIAGARALIKECGWNARSMGIGAACFWLNVGMEVWSCLHFNWQVAWNPDDWGVDMTMEKDTRAGSEEVWTHKILYVCAKVANFRASVPRFQESNATAQAMRMQDRAQQWEVLRGMCVTWNDCVPRTMQPAAFLAPHQTSSKSLFPEVWLIKRSSTMGRLFYHTSMCLLGQMNPLRELDDPEMSDMQSSHARMICGIVAHNKDRGVASAALRCISIGAECLTDFQEQAEILSILMKIKKETGWRIDFLEPELRKKWGWTDDYVRAQQARLQAAAPQDYARSSASAVQHPPPQPSPPPGAGSAKPSPVTLPAIPRGVVNPTMRTADFSAPTHPYQNYWVAPNPGHSDAHYFYRLTDNHYHG